MTPADASASAPPAISHRAGDAPDAGGEPGFWSVVLESLRGSRRDLTKTPLSRAILLLAVPMVLEMMGESVFAVADIFWVSKLGPDANATVTFTESMLTIIYALSMGVAMGVGAIVARRTGAGDRDGASRATVQAIIVGVGIALVLGLVGGLAGPTLLEIMGASPSVLATGSSFTRIMLGSCVVIVLLFVNNAAFRGAGDASVTMRTLWLANGINILLGPVLIFGLGPAPRLGVTGAAVATVIGRGTGVLYQFWSLRRGAGRLAVRREHLAIDPGAMHMIFRIARRGALQMVIATSSWIGLVRILSTFGSSVLAGYGIAIRVIMFALLPSWGLGNAAATLVGQSLGAGAPERGERAVWRAALYNLIFLGTVGLGFVVFATDIVRLFSNAPVVVQYGSQCLRIVAAGFAFYAYGMVVSQAFNGAGDTLTPTLINLGCFWVGELPLAYILARPLGMGPKGAFIAIATAFSAIAVVSVTIFRRGRWKTVRV